MHTNRDTSINSSRVLTAVGVAPKHMYNDVYIASVVNTNDPLSEGRVTLYVPQVLGTAVSNWAMPLGYVLTTEPTPGMMVHALFAGGDINRPLYCRIDYVQKAHYADVAGEAGSLTGYPGSWQTLSLGGPLYGAGTFSGTIRTLTIGAAQFTGTYTDASIISDGTTITHLPAGTYSTTSAQSVPCNVTSYNLSAYGGMFTTPLLNVSTAGVVTTSGFNNSNGITGISFNATLVTS